MKYKLLLGTLILSITAASAKAQKKESTSHTIQDKHITENITCYMPARLTDLLDTITLNGQILDSYSEPVVGAAILIKHKPEHSKYF